MDEPPSHILSTQGIILAVSAALVLTLIAAYASACEAAFFSLRESDLNKLRRSSNKRDLQVIRLLDNTHLFLLTCMVLNIIGKVGMVTMATLLVWNSDPSNLGLVITCSSFAVATLVFAEITARVYAIKNNEVLTFKLAPALQILVRIFSPFALPIVKVRELWDKRFEEKKSSIDDLSQAFELVSESDETTESDKDILRGIVNFGTLNVKQVMRLRPEIAAINTLLNFEQLIDAVGKSGFSRIPVFNKSLDNIEGVIYTKDLLPFLDYPSNFVWHQLIRPAYIVPETKKIDQLLKDFQEKRVHMAIASDERGRTTGLVTLEDLLEEIIGDINDKFDEVESSLNRFASTEGILRTVGKNSASEILRGRDLDPAKSEQTGSHRSRQETETQTRQGGNA